jgi:hypothetical protein
MSDPDLVADNERLRAEVAALRAGILAERVRCADLAEIQRLKIGEDPRDPSWTEHLAEVGAAILMGKHTDRPLPMGVHESHFHKAAHYLKSEGAGGDGR